MRVGKKLGKEAKFTTCPRCGLKSLAVAESCPECGLVFSRLDIATNADAKRKIRRGDRDFIIMTNKLPSDVSRIKLLLLTILAGLFGAHCFYVGRYWRGGLLLLNTIVLIMYVVFNAQLVAIDDGKLLAALTTIGGLIMLVWAFDVVWVILKRFKVPIAIDMQSQFAQEQVVENIDETETQENIKEEIKENNSKEKIQESSIKEEIKESNIKQEIQENQIKEPSKEDQTEEHKENLLQEDKKEE